MFGKLLIFKLVDILFYFPTLMSNGVIFPGNLLREVLNCVEA